ncbi:hypothetical protein SLS62_010131 [Diatrype stigma]|uniref:Cytochrome P450 n=1 Tax=Diatrype stigma TaxID=117547 RepID=A0AAN9YI06_9PEZI
MSNQAELAFFRRATSTLRPGAPDVFNNVPGHVNWLLRRQPGDQNAGFTINGEVDIQRHRGHRRNIGATYSATSVRKYGPHIDDTLRRFVTKLRVSSQENKVKSTALDLAALIYTAVVDCLGTVTLGPDWPPGLVDDAQVAARHWETGINKWRQLSLCGSLPWLTRFLQAYPGLKPAVAALGRLAVPKPKGYVPIEQTAGQLTKQRASQFFGIGSTDAKKADAEAGDQPECMLEELLRLAARKPEFKPHHATGMATINFIAGRDTTTATAVAALALISSDPAVKARVEAEVRDARNDDGDGIIIIPDLEKCRYTQACIKEAMRVRPALSLSMPRVVPPPSSTNNNNARRSAGAEAGLQLHGHELPPGTVVGVNPAALHLNPAVFGPDAASFRPERWLHDDKDKDKDRALLLLERTSLAWGGGAHACPGRHLAELIVARLVPLLVAEFDVEIARVPRLEDMRSFNYFATLTGVQARLHPRRAGGRG